MSVPVVEPTTIHMPSLARDYLARAEELFGKEFLGELCEEYDRGRSSRTPPEYPHRLARCLSEVRRAVANPIRGALVAVNELGSILELFEPWRGDPIWPSLLRSLVNPSEFIHALFTLAAARHLAADDQKVELCDEIEGRRSYDIRIVKPGLDHILAVEIKTPAELRRDWYLARGRSFGDQDATRIIDKALKSVGKGHEGQLGDGKHGILVIGGFFPSRVEIWRLGEAAKKRLRKSEGREQILGILLVVIAIGRERVVWTPQLSLTSIELYSQERLASWTWYTPNPKYNGDGNINV